MKMLFNYLRKTMWKVVVWNKNQNQTKYFIIIELSNNVIIETIVIAEAPCIQTIEMN